MKRSKVLSLLAGTLLIGGLTASRAGATTLDLFEWALNIDGTVSDSLVPDPVPAAADITGFDTTTGLGNVTVTVTGAGNHYVGGFFDIEIDQATNTYYNENGATTGSAAAGQSWEIDEPGYVFGDIYDNFSLSNLDNTNSLPAGSEDDVSMAMGWDFNLAAGEFATIDFFLSDKQPAGGFYLTQYDPDSQASVYFSSSNRIGGGGANVIPEPGTLILLGSGLLGLAGWQRKRSRA